MGRNTDGGPEKAASKQRSDQGNSGDQEASSNTQPTPSQFAPLTSLATPSDSAEPAERSKRSRTALTQQVSAALDQLRASPTSSKLKSSEPVPKDPALQSPAPQDPAPQEGPAAPENPTTHATTAAGSWALDPIHFPNGHFNNEGIFFPHWTKPAFPKVKAFKPSADKAAILYTAEWNPRMFKWKALSSGILVYAPRTTNIREFVERYDHRSRSQASQLDPYKRNHDWNDDNKDFFPQAMRVNGAAYLSKHDMLKSDPWGSKLNMSALQDCVQYLIANGKIPDAARLHAEILRRGALPRYYPNGKIRAVRAIVNARTEELKMDGVTATRLLWRVVWDGLGDERMDVVMPGEAFVRDRLIADFDRKVALWKVMKSEKS